MHYSITLKGQISCSGGIMLVISAYSLLLLKTVPTPEGSRSYFTVQLVSIIIGYVGAIILTIIDYRSIAKAWYFIGAISIILILYTLFLARLLRVMPASMHGRG